MARCSDCNKMVSLDTDVEPEEDDVTLTFSGEGDSVVADYNVDVTIKNNCADCGAELKTAALNASGSFDIDCSDYTEAEREEWSVELEGLGRKESGGGNRYSKKFYGFEATLILKDGDGEELERTEIDDEIQASGMDDA